MLARILFTFLVCLPLMAQTDLWVSNQSGNGSNLVYFNDGSGNLTNTMQSLGVSLSLSTAFGDLDGDGDIDIVDAADPGCWVYLNDGMGNFNQALGLGADLPITRSIGLADVDGDGDLDLLHGVADSQFTSTSEVFLNNGNAQFVPGGNFGANNTRSFAVGDLNGDGAPDIYEGIMSGADRVWLNNGSGLFQDSGQALGSATSFSVALADVEGDGDLDAFVAQDSVGDMLWVNDGNGTFSASAQQFTTSATLACAFGDVDGDGDQDLVLGNDGALNGDQLEVWLNNGAGNFTQTAQSSTAMRTVGLSFGDLDGDGDLDLYAANFGSDKLFFNDGSGNFTESNQTLSGGISWSGVLAYLQVDWGQALEDWGSPYSVQSLMQFQAQLGASFDFRRGR